jgi:hypothetical protein
LSIGRRISRGGVSIGLKPGYSLGSRITHPLVLPKSGRMHGYLPEHRKMNASFFIVGPPIAAAHSLGEIDMRDIAPTLAELLSFRLPSAEGQSILSGKGRRSRSEP